MSDHSNESPANPSALVTGQTAIPIRNLTRGTDPEDRFYGITPKGSLWKSVENGYDLETKDLVNIELRLLSKHKKWGWVIYRTTYADDEKWKKFNQIIQREVRGNVMEYWGLEDHLQYLDFPVREDADLFNKACTADIRKHFLAWRNSDAPFKEQGLEPKKYATFHESPISDSARYLFFIHVDEEAMESVLANAESDRTRARAYVNVVEADWPPSPDEDDPESELEQILSDCGHPKIEDMDTWEVGFQCVPIGTLYPFHWGDVEMENPIWYARPPKITGC
jgi:nuclear transport factor 2 (NTF2) superfamily protein